MNRIWWCEEHRMGWLPGWQIVVACPGGLEEGPDDITLEYACRMVERILASPEAIIIEKQEGEHCDDCGSAYSDVYRVDEDLWALLHERAPAGLLCPSCLVRRALSHERTGDAIDQLRADVGRNQV